MVDCCKVTFASSHGQGNLVLKILYAFRLSCWLFSVQESRPTD